MPKRYPLRTVLLMVVALAAFGRLWCLTHPPEVPDKTVSPPAEPARPTPPATPPTPPPGPPSLDAPADAPLGTSGSPVGEDAPEATPEIRMPGVEGAAEPRDVAEEAAPAMPGEAR